MIKANQDDKDRVVNILVQSFDDNKSVNYIIPQDRKRKLRIRQLMQYSFEVCLRFGKIFLSDDKKACALVVFPDKKKTTVWLDLKLIIFCIGLSNIKKTMGREARIKKLQPNVPMYYLWFIGVDPSEQDKGIGTVLLNEIIEESESDKRIICLETSTSRNLPWYEKFDFTIYNELNLGYKLFFLKRETNR